MAGCTPSATSAPSGSTRALATGGGTIAQLLPAGVRALPGATLFRLCLEGRETGTGFDLIEEVREDVERGISCFAPKASNAIGSVSVVRG